MNMINHDFIQANRKHFDTVANDYDKQSHAVELARRLARLFLASYPFSDESTSMLEFACGTGLLSQFMAPHCASIVGVDISEGMVNEYNKRVHNQGIPSDEMKAVCVDLTRESGELDGSLFDVIVCGAAYHHIPDINATTKSLASFLGPGGVIMVADLLKSGEGPDLGVEDELHPSEIVAHPGGLSELEIRAAFEHAGLQDLDFNGSGLPAKQFGRPVTLFLAKGIKASN